MGSKLVRVCGRVAASGVALAMGLCALPLFAGQNQPGAPSATVQQPASEPAPDNAPQAPAAEHASVPRKLTLRAGTAISVRTSQFLSSDRNRPGDGFSAELAQPLVVDGWVVARRGQTVLGRVAVAKKAGRVKGVSQLGVELSNLVLVDGQQLPVRTQLIETSAGTSRGRDAQAIGTTTGTGAAIGAIAHGGEGAGIGAAIGAAAGVAGVLLTRGRPTVIPPETLLTFQLEVPVSFSAERGGVAYRPVTQEDYEGGKALRRRTQNFAYPPPSYYAGFYPWGYEPWGFYPGPAFFGFYGFSGGGFSLFRR